MNKPDISRLRYDHAKHAYSLDDGRLLQGVTSVLDGTSSKSGLIQWAANCAVDFIKEYGIEKAEEARTAWTKKRDSAGQKGTDVHALVEEYILECIANGGKPIFATKHEEVKPFMEWAVANDVTFLASEQQLYSAKHMFAGTADFICILNGKLTIGDLKVKAKIWGTDPYTQCGAYSLMWTELTGEAPEQTVIIKMIDPNDERVKKYKNPPFEVLPRYAIREDEEEFLRRLASYRYQKNFKA